MYLFDKKEYFTFFVIFLFSEMKSEFVSIRTKAWRGTASENWTDPPKTDTKPKYAGEHLGFINFEVFFDKRLINSWE